MLYIVATPIGNLSELSPRAIEVLKAVDIIAAEDTRHSGMLLHHFDIKTPMLQYQRFNERESVLNIINRLQKGKDVALICDAGMPLISDPGSILIDECVKEGLEFTVVSGPCALINALVLSGLDTSSFCMLCFLPDKLKLRQALINDYLDCPSTLVFYSPPQSIQKDLDFLFVNLGKRRVSVARELTKKFEQVIRGTLGSMPEIKQKGEFVIVVEGFTAPKADIDNNSVELLVKAYLLQGFSKMEAIKRTAKEKGVKKSDVYDIINKPN